MINWPTIDFESKEARDALSIFQYVANWIPELTYSKTDGLGNFGILGLLGEIFLPCLQGGLLEIGVGVSSMYLAQLARKFGRKIYHCDAQANKMYCPMSVPGYLLQNSVFINQDVMLNHLSEIDFTKYQSILFAETSDNLFKYVPIEPIAFAFIDGDHLYEQVKKDFENLLPHMVDNGVICFHDTYPPDDSFLHESACGTVYKLRQEIQKDERFDCFTFNKIGSCDVGVSMVRVKPKNLPYYKQ